ncbi:MAG: alpha/beta hydrolase [Candidatus Eremiobacteraeota bacterium]|nr:alpha/beta hydrolase [Candidatus Eremiobacteraeota bacterium]
MRVTVDDAAFEVQDEGRGDAIVLLHGFPLTHAIWTEQVAALRARARILALDLRGMGNSSVTAGPYLIESLAGDLAAVLDSLHVKNVTIVGHSLGGYVAMAFCRMYVERVDRLALICSTLAADSAETAGFREALADRIERVHTMEPVVEAYMPKLFARRTIEENPYALTFAETLTRSNAPEGAAAMLRGMAARVGSYDIAEDLRMPVLIVAGARDTIVPPEEAGRIRDAFPNATLQVMPKSAHVPMLEEPAELTRVIAEFAAVRDGEKR